MFQWAVVAIIGCAGCVAGYYELELFTKARIGWALSCSIGWIIFSVAMAYAAMFPEMQDKHGRVIRYLVFADAPGREDLFQMMAYVVILWCAFAVFINRFVRKRFGE